MDQIIDFFSGLFSTDLWPARWHCGEWSDFHGWLYIISDLAIWSAYFAIPVVILKYMNKKSSLKFYRIYVLFAGFIVLCGLTHLLDAVTFWYPMYRLNALVRFFAGVISWATVYYLIKKLPEILATKTNTELENEIEKSRLLSEKLRALNDELVRQKNFTTVVLESSVDVITVVDKDLNYLLVNKVAGSLNILPADMIGQNLLSLFPQLRGGETHINIVKAMSGEVIHIEQYYSKLVQKYYENFFIPLYDNGSIYGVMIIGHDITNLIKANERLQETNMQLEQSNRDLEQFAYVASHDLQEPLRKISSFTNFMEKSLADEEKTRFYIAKILNASTRMTKLVQGALDYSKLSMKSTMYVEVDLGVIVKEIVNDFELTIQKRGAIVTVSDLPIIQGIEIQLTQLFNNLISNSLKYCTNIPQIEISAEIKDDISQAYDLKGLNIKKCCVITVKDNGIGFDQQYAQRIFGVFERLHTRSEYEGTGIGLAICKKIVEQHKGTIDVTSAIGIGTTFVITLPLKQLE